MNAEGLEVPGVSCRDRHLFGLGDRGDERVVERRVLGNAVGRKNPCGGKAERKHPPGKSRQGPFLEPPAQDFSLRWVGSFFRDHAAFKLGDGRGGHELVGDGD